MTMSDKRYSRTSTRERSYKASGVKKELTRKPQEHNQRNIRLFHLAMEMMQQHQTTEEKALKTSREYTQNCNVARNNENESQLMLQHEINTEKMKDLIIGDEQFSNWSSHKIGFKKLKELLKKQPKEILLVLNFPRSGFVELLRDNNIGAEMMTLLLTLLAKICSCTDKQNLAILFNKVISESHFIHHHLWRYVSSIEKLKLTDYNSMDSLRSAITFLSKVQQILPVSASNVLSFVLPELCDRVETLKKKGLILPHTMQNELQLLKDGKEAIVKAYDLRTREKISASERLHAKEPPEDYRTIPILPTKKDFMDVHPFLRPNIVQGSYRDVPHYLDVQFRLLREDYVRPFRESVRSYVNHNNRQLCKKDCRKTSVYTNVHVLCPYNTEGGLVHLISFDVKPFRHVQWEASKRLLSGSLLCLSSDNFDFMLFATVAKRDPTELARGRLEVHFEQLGEQIFSISPSTSFVMVESEAYFEAFRHTLAALQQMEQCTLPLKEYIVHVEKDIKVPKYLCINTTYDFSSTFNSINGCLNKIPVLKTDNWPSSRELGLDQSQYAALQAALTKAFAIIQGPPGTGKTFIGLKITQMLLENFDNWKDSGHCPILVVCYTNHALDQFLEGILSFTKDIVRIGGRCNNGAIKEYQLTQLRQSARAARKVPKHIYLQRRSVFESIEVIENSINCYTHLVENSTQQILPVMFLEAFMGSNHLCSLQAGPSFHRKFRSASYSIAEWLGIPDDYLDSWNADFSGDEEECPPSIRELDILDCRKDDIEFELSLREIDTDEYVHVNSCKVFKKVNNQEFYNGEWKLQGGYYKIKQYIKKQMTCQDMMTISKAKQINNVWRLQPADRWRLYRLWVAQYVANLFNIIAELHKCYHYESERLRELRNAENKYLMRNAKVVGMTTTGAGKYRDLLQELQPRIVIVEEAAEVLEAHIVTSLAINTEHLILIGDHQQLRPSPTVYELAVHYSLDISLFERMIKNGMTCHQLTQQHRMRPCISSLLTYIYSHLQNHPSVYNYENILGIGYNMFFINHAYKESSISDTDSYSNIHEAKFLVALCRYLRHQRYDASQITVLTTYSAQLFTLKRLMKGDPLFEGVRVTVVDNFQGEENDIILISFVRSNDKGSIGFLKVPNRVCVALSRAKKGLYCIGNFNLLAKESNLWKNIVGNVQAQGIIGQSLALNCQNHPQTIAKVEVAEDFLKYVPDGGCMEPCNFVMDCSHSCTRLCHPYDREHTAFKCKQECLRTCDNGHKCPKPCFKECGKCMVPVEKIIPRCRHRQLVPCHIDSNDFSCSVICNKMLPCHHLCLKRCYEQCEPCIGTVKRVFDCGHCVNILCSNDTSDLICPITCNLTLFCGHCCTEKCGLRPCPPCQHSIKKLFPCGHERIIKCSEFTAEQNSVCILPCAKPLDCKHKCQRICGHRGACGPCQQQCKRRLLCGDKCTLKCSERCPQLCKRCKPVQQQQNFHLTQNGVKKWSNPLGHLYNKKSSGFSYDFFIE